MTRERLSMELIILFCRTLFGGPFFKRRRHSRRRPYV